MGGKKRVEINVETRAACAEHTAELDQQMVM